MVVGSSTSDNEFKPTGDPVTSIPSERVLSCCSVLVYSKIICTQVKKKVMICFEISQNFSSSTSPLVTDSLK